jgi:protein tyrosine/serine phosphatase
LACAVTVTAWALQDNFHTVLPGKVYRSAQLSPSALQERINCCGLRAILNLRGANLGEAWYDEECSLAEQEGIHHYDLATDSEYPPTPYDLRETIEVLDQCERPLLIHCQSGIDRTGVVAAICVLLSEEGSTAKARDQFGLLYGALPWRASTNRQKAFLGEYEQWLAQHNQEHDADRFRDWALNVYGNSPALAQGNGCSQVTASK